MIVDGSKTWITAAAYADLVVVFGKLGNDAAAVVVPRNTAGVHVEKIPHPLGCRAAGHAHIQLDRVRLPAANVLGGTGQSLPFLVTSALAYGRMSVAWGCVGILRACLGAATGHARSRVQFGKPIAEHQLVSRLVAELFVAEQVATRVCRYASECWESGSPDLVVATVLAKHVSATQAMHGAASAMQVMASAGASDGHVVARAYRDAKLMETIEVSSEICQLMLADHALAAGRQEAEDAPGNFQHLPSLVRAERAWAMGDFLGACRAFDAAQREVRGQRRPWHQALILERCGLFLLTYGIDHGGNRLLRDARRATRDARTRYGEPPRRLPISTGTIPCCGPDRRRHVVTSILMPAPST